MCKTGYLKIRARYSQFIFPFYFFQKNIMSSLIYVHFILFLLEKMKQLFREQFSAIEIRKNDQTTYDFFFNIKILLSD